MSSWRKNGQDLAQTSRKWRKKISNGESDGERKIYPSANPGIYLCTNLCMDKFEHMKKKLQPFKLEGLFLLSKKDKINMGVKGSVDVLGISVAYN